jgi:hypothetical protein
MPDWKQITARIRRARTGKDPAAQLSNLYEKTRDAMVAFELARFFEVSGQAPEAAKWYLVAAERFRRADWKTKAQQAAERLGASPELGSDKTPADTESVPPPLVVPEPGLPFEQSAIVFESAVAPQQDLVGETSTENEPPDTKTEQPARQSGEDPRRRRRGRRGGRSRRKPDSAKPATGAHVASETQSAVHRHASSTLEESLEPRFSRVSESVAVPRLPVEPLAESGPAVRGRYGDPGLSSRISLLEMQFRRLLTCTPARLDEFDRAPVGPGVFLLTDSDLTSYYYVEACQTLRIALANLSRGGSSRRGADSIKPQLAEHLGIAETRVAKYLADHCVVRWLQLDEGASHFAHFVIAVLRPVLNE